MTIVAGVLALLAVAWRFRPRADRPTGRWRSVVAAGVAVAGAVVLGPVPVALALATWPVAGWWRSRRAVARRRDAIARGLPDAVDLLAASLEVGRPVVAALHETARWAPDALRGALLTAVGRLDAGWRRSDALEALVDDLGPEVRPLVSALLASDRYGVPVADAVRRLVGDMRRRRRLDAEVAARRLPVRLTIPLVVAVLPAFGLLTVLPILLSALRGLGAQSGP